MARSTISVTDDYQKDRSSPTASEVFTTPVICLLLGLLLIVTSFLPLGDWTAQSRWTPEDATHYDRISLEYHMSATRSAGRAGLSQAEMDAQRQRLKEQFEAMRGKLEKSQQQPQLWSRTLLGTGALLASAGLFLYLKQQG